jgi:hypothetical protein
LIDRVLFPVLQSYVLAGEFTVFEKLRTAIKENLIFYVVAGVIGGVFIIWLAVKQGFGFAELKSVGQAAGNAWGLFLLIGFLGYGVVELPKLFWRKANRHLRLRYLQFEAVARRQALDASKKTLETTLKVSRREQP